MLYGFWMDIAQRHRSELAVLEIASGRRWTFGLLAEAGEKHAVPEGPVAFPKGKGIDFLLDLLASWRCARASFPIENNCHPSVPLPLPQGCCHIKATSASTGAARLVLFTADQLRADARNIVATMGLRPDWPNLGFISMAHSYGFSNLVLPLLLHGIPLVIGDAPLPERLKRAAAEFSAVTLPGVPALWRTWADAATIPSNARLAISAGAPLPLRLEEEIFSREGIKVHNFYGSSECGGIAYDRTEKPRPDAALVGTALEGVRVKGDGEGCLMVESEAVGLGYWPAPEPALGSGRFITSDLVRIDGDRIFLEGRRNDLINVAGRKISPEAIERVLSGCDGVRDCVVFGVAESREERFERVVAAVALADGASLDGVKQFAQEQLATWQWPREWWVATEPLQTNSRGKRARADVREQYLATGRQRKSEL